METREYFEKIMQDYNQNRNGRSLRNILASRWWQAAKPSGKDEAVDYNWLMEFKKTFSASKPQVQQAVHSFVSLSLEEETPKKVTWEVKVQESHEISRETLILLLSTAIQTKIAI
jgi:hypothetical protein